MESLKIWLPKLLVYVVAGVLVLALFNIIKMFLPEEMPWQSGETPVLEFEDVVEENTEIVDLAVDLSGYLYFDSLADSSNEAGDTELANIYRYDFASETTMPVVEVGESYDGNPIGSTSIAFVTSLYDEDQNIYNAHVLLNTGTNEYIELTNGEGDQAFELAVAPENPDSVAYVFRDDDAEDQYLTTAYVILVSDYALGTDKEIYEAVSPTWNASGTALYFVREDGIYRYDLTTDSIDLINNEYTDHSVFTHLAVAPDESFMVMTLPALNTISVLNIGISDEGMLAASGAEVIQTENVIYKTPVVSPDSRFYTVVATREGEEREGTIEIRSHYDRSVITRIKPDGLDLRYLNLSAWNEEGVLSFEDMTEGLITSDSKKGYEN